MMFQKCINETFNDKKNRDYSVNNKFLIKNYGNQSKFYGCKYFMKLKLKV